MSDRICVALSRAPHCLIRIGNMKVMSEASVVWGHIQLNQQTVLVLVTSEI